MIMPRRIDIDPEPVERYLQQLARFGAVGPTGVSRPVYSPEWVAAQDQVAVWGREADLAVRRDAVGNIWSRLNGTEDGKVIVTGSHIDTQRPGGRYDGALGVIGGVGLIGGAQAQTGAAEGPLR